MDCPRCGRPGYEEETADQVAARLNAEDSSIRRLRSSRAGCADAYFRQLYSDLMVKEVNHGPPS